MWKKPIHTEKYILKMAEAYGLTPAEIKNKFNDFYGLDWLYYQVINCLRYFTAKDMRFIFRIKQILRKERIK